MHSLSTIHENDIETGAILRIVPLDESGHDPDFLDSARGAAQVFIHRYGGVDTVVSPAKGAAGSSF